MSNQTFGLPSVPRQSMPSMFQILGWYSFEEPKKVEVEKVPCEQEEHNHDVPTNENVAERGEQKVVENVKLTKSFCQKESPKKRQIKSMTKSGIYEYKDVHLKRSASVKMSETVGSRVTQVQKIQPVKKKLDPNNASDLVEIQKRKERIQKFGKVTRDLSNSAFNTYYGKPVFEAYGRSNSNPKLLSHNVMPHRGLNNPKDVQSYYSALIKGKGKNLQNFVPRKPIEQIIEQVVKPTQSHKESINLPLNSPDLINCPRFTAEQSHKSKNEKIPNHKIAPPAVKAKKAKKAKRTKRKKPAQTEITDGLKYMNTRQNLLQILQKKKTNASKLAWKVTQCYPFDLNNEQKMKQSTKEWENVHAAGVSSMKCDSVGDLITIAKKND